MSNDTKSVPEDLTAAGWVLAETGDAINKSFRFENFTTAMSFMLQVAFKAEALDHHPEWFNVYNKVDVRLTTHDTAGLSDKDFALARFMEITAK